MEKELRNLLKNYYGYEGKITKRLEKLGRYGRDCNCIGDVDTIKLIHEGEYYEIRCVCLKCGGERW